jgi:inorganic pyrophosphatase
VTDDAPLKAIVEIPKGSRNKYEFDEETGEIEFDRRLYSAVSFPTDYGFLPGTLSAQGDPMDVLVCVTEPTFPGCRVAVKPVALLKMTDEKGPDPKVLCVPLNDPAWNRLEGVDELPADLADEIAHFFSVYTDLEGQPVEIEGWGSREEADAEIERGQQRFRDSGD